MFDLPNSNDLDHSHINQTGHATPTIIVVGLNHKTAPVELREKFAFSSEDIQRGLSRLLQWSDISESIILSTCNRVEIIISSTAPEHGYGHIIDMLQNEKQIDTHMIDHVLYKYYQDHAIRHIFRVTASLDSMIIGEPQISGQMKEAYRLATLNHATGPVLNRLMHRAFSVAKRVRTETGIGDHAVSISYAAIELARKIFGELTEKTVLLIGAGEMAELAVEHLIRHHAGQIYVANRTFERGLHLAKRFHGIAIRFDEISEYLTKSDIIISSTGSASLTLTRDSVKKAMRVRKNRPIFFIDIAVPRDIDPDINRLTNAYVYDIDDLQDVIKENMDERKNEAIRAERLIDEAVILFKNWLIELDFVPTILAMRTKIDTILSHEIQKTSHSLSNDQKANHEALKRMAKAIANKVLHDPIQFMKSSHRQADKLKHIDTLRKIFNLDCRE